MCCLNFKYDLCFHYSLSFHFLIISHIYSTFLKPSSETFEIPSLSLNSGGNGCCVNMVCYKKVPLHCRDERGRNKSKLSEWDHQATLEPFTSCIPSSCLCFLTSRDESAAYLAGLGTVGMEIYEQVPKLDAVVVPAAGQYGLLAGTAAAIKHLNSRILVIVS